MLAFDVSRPVSGSASIEIAKPIGSVFSYVAEDFFENYPKWALEVIEFKPIGEKATVGAMAVQTREEQGQSTVSTIKVTVMLRDELLVLEGVSEPFRQSYYFKSLGENDTRLTFRFDLLELEVFMRPFEKLIRKAIEEGAQNSVENIKNLVSEDSIGEKS